MVPRENANLTNVLKLPVDAGGFYNEIHPKLRPVETLIDGVFISGAAQGPKTLAESVAIGSEPALEHDASHVLYQGRAFALGSTPLVVGRGADPDAGIGIALPEGLAGISRRHCTFVREGEQLVLVDHSAFGTFVNGARVAERTRVRAGDRVRIGEPGVELALIAVGA